MANTFKNASLSSVSDSAAQTLYTAPASTTTVVLGLALSNKTATTSWVDVVFTDNSASTDINILKNVSVPPNTTIEVLSGQKYILETGDLLKCLAQTANAIDVTLGVMEIS